MSENTDKSYREELLDMLWYSVLNYEPLMSDEERFLRYLIRKWSGWE